MVDFTPKASNLVAVLLIAWCFTIPGSLLVSAQGGGYDSLCDDNNVCNETQHLECNSFTSRCWCANRGFFDGVSCRRRESSPCIPGAQPCIQNAACIEASGPGSGHICICEAGFESNSQDLCYLPHDAPCGHGPGVDQCDPVEHMQCGVTTNRCECKDRYEAAYFPDEKTCNLRSGARCGADAVFPNQRCAMFSHCGLFTSRCECDSPFQPNQNRICFRPHESACLEHRECDASSWQQCERSCICSDQTNTFFDRETGECRKLVDTNCEPPSTVPSSQPCVQNSYCNGDRRRCECETGLNPDADRQCYLAYNASCNPAQNLCNAKKYMECSPLTGACACKSAEETTLDLRDGVCKLRAEAACSEQPNSQPCISDSICSPSGGPVPTRCKCQFNLEPNEDRFCYLMYGRQCDVNLSKCDPASNLVCNRINSTCSCSETTWYDGGASGSGICKAFLEGTCRRDKDCPRNANCHLEQCVCNEGFEGYNGMQCLKSYGATCGDEGGTNECNIDANLQCIGGLCLCPAGHVPEGPTVKCLASYQYPCNATIGCSNVEGLACIASKCDCVAPGEQIYLDGRCGSLVDNRCHLNGDDDSPGLLRCINNAECVVDPSVPLMGKCQCKPGFLQTLSKTCTASSAARVWTTLSASVSGSLTFALILAFLLSSSTV